MTNGKDTVQVFLPGTKRKKTMSSTDVVPTSVQVVLKPLENVGTVSQKDLLTKVRVFSRIRGIRLLDKQFQDYC